MDLIAREAGGKTTDIFGDPLKYDGDDFSNHGCIISCGEPLHNQLIEVVATCQKNKII